MGRAASTQWILTAFQIVRCTGGEPPGSSNQESTGGDAEPHDKKNGGRVPSKQSQNQVSAAGTSGSSSGPSRDMVAHLQAMTAQALADDDASRVVGAAHSAALVAFMQHPLVFQGLLGLDEPPTAVSHPHLSDLAEHPFWQHPHIVREAVLRNLG